MEKGVAPDADVEKRGLDSRKYASDPPLDDASHRAPVPFPLHPQFDRRALLAERRPGHPSEPANQQFA